MVKFHKFKRTRCPNLYRVIYLNSWNVTYSLDLYNHNPYFRGLSLLFLGNNRVSTYERRETPKITKSCRTVQFTDNWHLKETWEEWVEDVFFFILNFLSNLVIFILNAAELVKPASWSLLFNFFFVFVGLLIGYFS